VPILLTALARAAVALLSADLAHRAGPGGTALANSDTAGPTALTMPRPLSPSNPHLPIRTRKDDVVRINEL